MTDSAALRRTTLAARNAMPATQRQQKSATIISTLLRLPEISASQSIFLYVSFRSEVATFALLDSLLEAGKEVSVPYTHVQQKYLDAIRITDPASQLVPGYCDIPEPNPAVRASQRIDPATIDAIILPGSVFDLRGGRFGYGGGFYDRFVSLNPRAWRIGLAYDLQIVPEAPLQAHDELLDLVITETRVIRGSRQRPVTP